MGYFCLLTVPRHRKPKPLVDKLALTLSYDIKLFNPSKIEELERGFDDRLHQMRLTERREQAELICSNLERVCQISLGSGDVFYQRGNLPSLYIGLC